MSTDSDQLSTTPSDELAPAQTDGLYPAGQDPDHPIADPGVEEHQPRLSDVNKAAADRAARQVIWMFLAVPLFAIAYIVAYFAIPSEITIDLGFFHASAQHVALGLTLGIAVLLIGIATQQWARQLMSNHEIVEERHPSHSPEADQAEVMRQLDDGIEESGVPRRKMLIISALGAIGILAAPALVMYTDLGPVANKAWRKEHLESTLWDEGVRLVNDITYTPLKAEDIVIGQLVNGAPENLTELHGVEFQNAKAKAPIVIVRMNPEDITIPEDRQDWQVGGILAYSKICTHVGCPISLWEQQTHHLLCPCHQSTFDLADSGRVVFGPAARALPQLPIKVDGDGYLLAQSDFTVPVGPSFFERDSRNDLGESEEYR